jgi:hypothetical protein
LQQTNQCVQVRGEEILAAEMSDDALFDFVAVAKRFD